MSTVILPPRHEAPPSEQTLRLEETEELETDFTRYSYRPLRNTGHHISRSPSCPVV